MVQDGSKPSTCDGFLHDRREKEPILVEDGLGDGFTDDEDGFIVHEENVVQEPPTNIKVYYGETTNTTEDGSEHETTTEDGSQYETANEETADTTVDDSEYKTTTEDGSGYVYETVENEEEPIVTKCEKNNHPCIKWYPCPFLAFFLMLLLCLVCCSKNSVV